ncbi:MAG: UDP-N-acetylmuramoyl-tripeptide--D-alanyl-D-alanine ligase [Planctomycetes bacterium]|nr:UDP-N-acetylmuramoyl-tripeptide--D-alanyl-D-alanine ligase [Planctomycetota bacterium]
MFKSFTLIEAVWVLEAKLLSPQFSLKSEVTGICTDSRKIEKGNLFIAINGENFNGHDFVKDAVAKGACGAIVNSVSGLRGVKVPILIVGNTVKSYGDLAAWYLRNFNVQRIALTGSAGKTTTREMIASILATKGKVHRNEANENNLIGVPKTIFALDESHDYLVLELGTNEPGEIDQLTSIAQPDCAVLLNALPVHLEGLKSLQGVIQEKSMILKETDLEVAIVNFDDMGARSTAKNIDAQLVRVGQNKNFEVFASEILNSGDAISFKVNNRYDFMLNLPGNHNVHNALAAIAVGMWAGVRFEDMQNVLRNLQPLKMRNQIVKTDEHQIVFDCYNANPASMKAALDVLGNIPAKRHIAVLGDMLELGMFGDMYHQQIGYDIAKSNIDVLITAGELSRMMHKPANSKAGIKTMACDSTEDAADALLKEIQPGDAILLKASRGLHFEMIFERINEFVQSSRCKSA